MMTRIYINAYAVSRHYGGPEEGGWWFNAGQPLASVPLAVQESVTVEANHSAGRGEYYLEEVIDRASYDHSDDAPDPRCWILRFDADRAERVEAELRETLGDVAYGDIYSMRGGRELQVRRELHLATAWSDYRPYE
jgi:hypothetical protein